MSETTPKTPADEPGCEIKDRCRKAQKIGCSSCARSLPPQRQTKTT